jgi:biopolymer transport protein TolR
MPRRPAREPAVSFGRLERPAGSQPMSDINMTPLIDVMLVLLVIFMITAPLMASSLKLELPKTEAGQPNDAPQFVAVALDPQGRYYFGEEAMDAATFSARIGDAARRNPQTEVQLRADRNVPYGRVAELIGIVQKAGLSRVGFVTEPANENPSTPAAAAAAPAPAPELPGSDSGAPAAGVGRPAPSK